jgi:hypothetical protein
MIRIGLLSATVFIPGEDLGSFFEGERPTTPSDQLSYPGKESDRYVFVVGSGSCQFNLMLCSP